MVLWISGGGTGGHVYPGLTVVEDWRRTGDVTAAWLGSRSGMEAALVARHGLEFHDVPSGPIVGTSPLRAAASLVRLVWGAVRTWHLMGAARPDVVLVTGGYVAVPVSVAAWARGVPLAVYLPDATPGRAVQLIARLADLVLVTHAAALPYAGARAVVTGYPVRAAVREASRSGARERLGLPPHAPVVLVFGGSRGARRLNRAVTASAEALLDTAYVLHVTGPADHAAVRAERAGLSAEHAAKYQVWAYLHDAAMADALAAADLVVSRAGAATLGEYPARALPSILVPLTLAGGHQAKNAAVLRDAGAAVVIDDAELDGPRLAEAVQKLVSHRDRLARMASGARTLDRPDAARAIRSHLEALALGWPGSEGDRR